MQKNYLKNWVIPAVNSKVLLVLIYSGLTNKQLWG